MNAKIAANNKPVAPAHNTKCYGCDSMSVGVTERWTDGKMVLVYACKRHSDPHYSVLPRVGVVAFSKAEKKAVPAKTERHLCIYCDLPTRKGSLFLGSHPDGAKDYAHHACHAEALKM